jgi:hypothetical protein
MAVSQAVLVATAANGASVSTARPANTPTYSAGAVQGAAAAAIEFTNIGFGPGEIRIDQASLEIDLAAVPAGMTSFRLHCYNVTPPSAFADGTVWDLTAGDRAAYQGYIDLGTPVDVGSTLFVETTNIQKFVTLLSTSMFGYLVTNGGYIAASGTVQTIKLHSLS